MTPLFNFAADLHLQPSAWGNRDSLRGDSYYSFQQIIADCLARQLPLVLGGDVIDVNRTDPATMAVIYRAMDQMAAAGLPVKFIQGQHELDRNNPWLRAHDWPEWIHLQSTVVAGCNLYGIDWYPRGQLQELLRTVPANTTFLIMHTVWDNFMGRGNTDASFDDLPPVPWVLTGDFHVETTVVHRRDDGSATVVVSPGSTCLQAVNEPVPKFYMTFCQDGAGGILPERRPLDVRRVIPIEIMTEKQLADFLVYAPTTLGARPELHCHGSPVTLPILRIKYLETLPDVYNKLRIAAAPEDRIFFDPVRDVVDTVVDADALPADAFSGLGNAIQSLAGTNTNAAAETLRLLQASDRKQELELMFTEFRAQSQLEGQSP